MARAFAEAHGHPRPAGVDVLVVDRRGAGAAEYCVENPASEVAASLHLYGGDLPGVAGERTLWSAEQKRKEFSFPELLGESLGTMKQSGNDVGVNAILEAIRRFVPSANAPIPASPSSARPA